MTKKQWVFDPSECFGHYGILLRLAQKMEREQGLPSGLVKELRAAERWLAEAEEHMCR